MAPAHENNEGVSEGTERSHVTLDCSCLDVSSIRTTPCGAQRLTYIDKLVARFNRNEESFGAAAGATRGGILVSSCIHSALGATLGNTSTAAAVEGFASCTFHDGSPKPQFIRELLVLRFSRALGLPSVLPRFERTSSSC